MWRASKRISCLAASFLQPIQRPTHQTPPAAGLLRSVNWRSWFNRNFAGRSAQSTSCYPLCLRFVIIHIVIVEWIVCGPSACEGIFMNYKPGFSTKNQTAKYVKMLFWKHFRRRRMTATGSDIDNEAVVSGCQALAATKRWLTGRHIQKEEDWRDEMPSHRWNQNGCRPPELKSWGVRQRPSLGRSTERIQDMWAGGLRPELYRFSELFSAPQRVQCEIARPRFSGSVCKCSCDSGGPTGHSHL